MALSNEASKRLKPKLNAVEAVRSELSIENIQVPGVIVIGAQSAAKSSVLEAISGVNFPRGANTCTRRPCILRIEADAGLKEEYALVSNSADLNSAERINLADIGGEIERLTLEKAGAGTTIIVDPLYVRVCKTLGPTLTLIDLPGITHVHDTQTDIHDVIVAMIRNYIKNEQAVILAVVPAVDDFGNCEALKLAREVDPEGQRTLGVVTKPDMIQLDSDLPLKLRAERHSDIPLNLGWISIRCRTPTEVQANISPSELAVQEKLLFDTHSVLSGLDQRYWGLPTLTERVVDVQEDTIDKWLPQVRHKIQDSIFEKLSQLRQLPAPCDDDVAKMMMFNKLVRTVREVFDKSIVGNYTYQTEKELHIPPRLTEFFGQFMEEVLQKTPDFLSDDFTKLVEKQDLESRGCSLPNFLSDPVFRLLFLKEFETAVPPAVWTLMNKVHEYISKVLNRFVADTMADFPRLVGSVQTEVRNVVQKQYDEARAHVGFLLRSQKVYMGTLDESGYVKLIDEMSQLTRGGLAEQTLQVCKASLASFGIVSDNLSELTALMRDKPRIFNMQISLAAYTKLVQRQLMDQVTKTCYLLFVEDLRLAFTDSLTCKGIDFVSPLMRQDRKVTDRRRLLESSLGRLKRSLETLEVIH